MRARITAWVVNRLVGYVCAQRRRANLAPALGRILQAYLDGPGYAELFRTWERQGVHVTRNAFYSPIPDTQTLDDSLWERRSELCGVDMNADGQLRLLTEVFPRYRESSAAVATAPTGVAWEFHLNNETFDGTDALVLNCMLRHFRPRRVVEIGSGYSTRLMAQIAHELGGMDLVSVDPYPGPAVAGGMPGLAGLRAVPVESVPLELFQTLGDGDLLFIDSSHALRCGGDVQYLYLDVLPRLRPGVLVHVHDIFFPLEYPRRWIKEHCIFWTEQYLLQAFLAFNREFEMLFANQFVWQNHPDLMRAAFPASQPWWGGGSVWLRRRKAAES